jgi:hypothetical protein
LFSWATARCLGAARNALLGICCFSVDDEKTAPSGQGNTARSGTS